MAAATATGPVVTSGSNAKIVFFVVFFALTVLLVYHKDARVFDPQSPIARHFAPAKWYLVVHGLFGAVAMAVAAFQFSNRLRARYLPVHRVLGYAYVTSVFISAPFGAAVAFRLSPNLSLVGANFVQSFGWISTTAIALQCIRCGNVVAHRRWMIRSYPFAMVFTFARAIRALPPVAHTGVAGQELVVWGAIALASFLPNIFLEWREIFPRKRAKDTAVLSRGAAVKSEQWS